MKCLVRRLGHQLLTSEICLKVRPGPAFGPEERLSSLTPRHLARAEQGSALPCGAAGAVNAAAEARSRRKLFAACNAACFAR